MTMFAAGPERRALSVAVLFCAVFFLAEPLDAAGRPPVRIGFAACLTGKDSGFGIQGRNGAMLAVEDANRQGGIRGRPLTLITRDNRRDPMVAVKVHRELIDEKVAAIVGHFTSGMSEATVALANESKIVTISPTAATDRLSGRDDYFFRVINPYTRMTDLKAEYAAKKMRLRRVAVLYDVANKAYTESYVANFTSTFERLDGKVVSALPYRPGPGVRFRSLARALLKNGPEGLLIVAGPADTAMVCQHVRLTGSRIPILISGWAATPDLLRHGGPAVEGVIATQFVDYGSTTRALMEFRKRFRKRFGRDEPSVAAIFAYEAVMVIRDALTANPDPAQLKETIVRQKVFQGLGGPFEIDRYGDGRRKLRIMTVLKNRFTVKDER